MNAPGSPSSPLQTTYFGSPGGRADLGPLHARWESRPRRGRAARSAGSRSMICSGDSSSRQRRRASKPSCRRYSSRSVGSSWPQYSVARCCCAAEERADRAVADVDRVPGDRVGQSRRSSSRSSQPDGRVADAPQQAPRAGSARSTIGRTSSACTLANSCGGPSRRHDLHQRRLVAHADAADPLHHGRRRRSRPALRRSPRWTLPLPWATQQEPSPMRISPSSPLRARRPACRRAAPLLLLVRGNRRARRRPCRGVSWP